MVKSLLQEAIKTLNRVIELTREDIALIKEMKHDALAERDLLKKSAVANFETIKSKLNASLQELTTLADAPLEEVLEQEERELLEQFKAKLLELKEVNRQCSLLVVSLNEFYTSLLSNMFKFDNNGYHKTNPLPAALMKVSA